ncbi:MAG: hypothetical protein FWE47_00995 [Oscillospiraceae bacterium]|nr:hypothetical protein [Oscillospiraceae bacterium]
MKKRVEPLILGGMLLMCGALGYGSAALVDYVKSKKTKRIKVEYINTTLQKLSDDKNTTMQMLGDDENIKDFGDAIVKSDSTLVR